MPTSSLTPDGLKRYNRWLAVQKAKGRVPSASETSAFLQGEIEANISTDQQNQALSLNREQVKGNLALGQQQLDLSKKTAADNTLFRSQQLGLIKDQNEAQERANKIRGISEITKLGLAVNEGTDGAIWEGVKDVAGGAYELASGLFDTGSAIADTASTAAEVGGEFAAFADAFDTSEIASSTIPVWEATGTVLCTELYRQGLMSENTYRKDSAYGASLPTEVMTGYVVWAAPLAKLMKKSRVVTNIMKYPITMWANHMAGKRNWFGAVCLAVGIPVCGLIGRMLRPFKMEAYDG